MASSRKVGPFKPGMGGGSQKPSPPAFRSDIGEDVIADALRSVEKHRRKVAGNEVVSEDSQEFIVDPAALLEAATEEAAERAASVKRIRKALEGDEADVARGRGTPTSRALAEKGPASPPSSQFPSEETAEVEPHPSPRPMSAPDLEAESSAQLLALSAELANERAAHEADRQVIDYLRRTINGLSRQKLDTEATLEHRSLEAKKNFEMAARATADLENFRKRSLREKAEQEKYGAESCLREFLPVLDNLERAMAHSPDKVDVDALVEGVRMTIVQFTSAFKRFGVARVEATPGAAFDPTVHEAMWEEASPHPQNTIAREVQAGYLLQDRLLRAALVVVSKPLPADPTPTPPEGERSESPLEAPANGADEPSPSAEMPASDLLPSEKSAE